MGLADAIKKGSSGPTKKQRTEAESMVSVAAAKVPAKTAASPSTGSATATSSVNTIAKTLEKACRTLEVGNRAVIAVADLADQLGRSRAATVFALTDTESKDRLHSELVPYGLLLVTATPSDVTVERVRTSVVAKAASGASAEPEEPEAAAEAPPTTKPNDDRDPEYFHLDPALKLRLEVAAKAGLNVWAVGPTGCGKTETLALILKERNPIKLSFNGESSTDELIGCYQLVPGKDGGAITQYFAGALERAMREGRPLLAEEVDAAPAECNLAMQRALERVPGQPRRWYNPLTQEDVEAKDGFFIWATANTAGGGDFTGNYLGTQPQNAAFRDRFVFEEFDYLPAGDETLVLVKRTGIDRDAAKKAVDFARAVRQSSEVMTPVSTRSLLAFAELAVLYLSAGMQPRAAYAAAMNSALLVRCGNPTDREALRQFAQRHFG